MNQQNLNNPPTDNSRIVQTSFRQIIMKNVYHYEYKIINSQCQQIRVLFQSFKVCLYSDNTLQIKFILNQHQQKQEMRLLVNPNSNKINTQANENVSYGVKLASSCYTGQDIYNQIQGDLQITHILQIYLKPILMMCDLYQLGGWRRDYIEKIDQIKNQYMIKNENQEKKRLEIQIQPI
ncbi:hypothetical protein pb186bvf_020529 [Paramecium bursaria]